MTISDVRRCLLAVSMTAAGVALLLGHLWNTPSTLTASGYVEQVARSHGQFAVATLLTAVAALLLIPSSYGIERLVYPHMPRLATAGAGLASIGAAGLAIGVSIIGFTMSMLTAHDPALAQRVYTIASDDSFVMIPFDLAPLFTIGMLLLGLALVRTRVVPRWQPVLLILGAVAAVGAPGGGAAGALGHAPLAVALVALAREVWQLGRAREAATAPADVVTAS